MDTFPSYKHTTQEQVNTYLDFRRQSGSQQNELWFIWLMVTQPVLNYLHKEVLEYWNIIHTDQ